LFISIRRGASVIQLLHESVVPIGDFMNRGLGFVVIDFYRLIDSLNTDQQLKLFVRYVIRKKFGRHRLVNRLVNDQEKRSVFNSKRYYRRRKHFIVLTTKSPQAC
jgi:hypothetical protein